MQVGLQGDFVISKGGENKPLGRSLLNFQLVYYLAFVRELTNFMFGKKNLNCVTSFVRCSLNYVMYWL